MFTFSLGDLEEKDPQAVKEYPFRHWEEVYRGKWRWDKVYWGTHGVDCWPSVGACPYRVYVREGKVLFEEQSGGLPASEEGVPDWNPMGCQKGSCWSCHPDGKERLLYPLKRVGERGSGQWQRISWDQALSEVADAMIDAIQEVGPESIISLGGCNGGWWGFVGRTKLLGPMGGVVTDLDSEMNDMNLGMYMTLGKIVVTGEDDWFHSDLILIWHMNPIYTRIPFYHFAAEARYRGAEVVTIAPDFSPSAVHADFHVPVKPGSDAALALGMCKVIVDEGLYNAAFVKEQTDMPLLVRLDNRRFLRGSDVEEGGKDDQFYIYDSKAGQVTPASRTSLALDGFDPALEGTFSAALKDGRPVAVTPVFELLKERLREYEPAKAATMCGISADIITVLARKAATRKTTILEGFNSMKYYHGDLMDRAMYLMLALTGNWGKKGTGMRNWSPGPNEGSIFMSQRRPGREGAQEILQTRQRLLEAARAHYPDFTDEMIAIEATHQGAKRGAGGAEGTADMFRMTVPPVFYWYYHGGFRELWNKRDWGDPTMTRPFDDYFRQAMEQGWWDGYVWPPENIPPRVFIEAGGNSLRRTRGGQSVLLKNLWPKLRMVVTMDYRMSTTALFSDIVLPTTTQYEKPGTGGSTHHVLHMVLSERAAEPPGEAKTEWEIFRLLAKKVEERAKARNFVEYKDAMGGTRRLDNLYQTYTMGGAYEEGAEEKIVEQQVEINAMTGVIPADTTIETLREKGVVKITGHSLSPYSLGQASDITTDETFNPLRWHTEKKMVYPTLTRRAQFYIDHDWFLEAGEELPCHKAPPKMGGDHPFQLTSGHNRWSIHSDNIANRVLLETHRGRPHMVMNSDDAAAKGIRDQEEVRLYNDLGSIVVPVKLSPAVRPGQVIIYNGWDPYQFRNWHGPSDLEPGMVKWLHLAGGYGHLRYFPMEWQPLPADRATRVDVAKID